MENKKRFAKVVISFTTYIDATPDENSEGCIDPNGMLCADQLHFMASEEMDELEEKGALTLAEASKWDVSIEEVQEQDIPEDQYPKG